MIGEQGWSRLRRGVGGAGLVVGAVCAVAPSSAQEWDLGASVGAEVRYFPNDPAYPGQLEGAQSSIILNGDVRWYSDSGAWRVVALPFARIDDQDDERTHADLREAYVQWIGDAWEVRAGLGKVFWGTAESRHLVDVINQTDGVEDIDEEDKLGQPMVEIATQRDWGRLEFYVLPGFRERTFPGEKGRFRTPLPVDMDAAVYDSPVGDGRIDVAGRYTHFIGDWDVGLSVFHGTSREPGLGVNGGGNAFVPVYDVITQAGADVQYTTGAWAWKGEAIVREGHGDTFAAGVGGFEYTFYGVTGNGADLGVLVEYQFDGRDGTAPPTVAQNDVFFGARYALNDFQDTAILAGGGVDLDDGSSTALVEAERRLGQAWTAALEARFFLSADEANLAAAFADDDVVTARLTRYF